MDDLNNTQIVLLALLVSFVSSAATSIITTSLLDEAPVQVGRTVNRVVERTIERVVPEENDDEPQEVIRETVVVKQDDAVVDIVARNDSRLVRLFVADGSGAPVAVGAVISEDGRVVTDGAQIAQGVRYIAETAQGTFEMESIYDPDDTVAILALTNATSTPFSPVVLGQGQAQLGQSVVALGGFGQTQIAEGRITSRGGNSETSTSTNPTAGSLLLGTSIAGTSLGSGHILLNLSGEVVGIRTSGAGVGMYTPVEKIISARNASQTP